MQYDKAAARWVFTKHAFNSGGPYYECVAVSTTSDATGTYNLYAYQLPNFFPDYPKLGVWPDAYYLTIDELDPQTFAYAGVLVCALDRNSMLTGAAAPAQCFQLDTGVGHSLLPSDLDGSTPPPSGSPNYFMNLGSNSLNVWQFHVDWLTPANSTFTGPVNLPVAPIALPCSKGNVCIPQANTTQRLDSVGERLMYRLAYRNFGAYESIVVNHSIATGTGNVGVRWYEIRNPAGNPPDLYQQGTFAPDTNFRWMGSIAMDSAGDIALGYSVSSSSMAPAIRYTSRLATDALGTFAGENSIIEGGGSEQGSNRWGDYSSMSVDPVDDCTFWYTNQYLQTTGSANWTTRIASFSIPACSGTPPPVNLSSTSLLFGPQLVGTSSTGQTVTLTNNQATTLNIFSVNASGDFLQAKTCGSTVPAGGNCTLTVTFRPTATGNRSGALTINDDAGNSPQVVNLSGTGIAPAVSLSATTLTFPGTLLGVSSGTKKVTLTNTGTAPLTVQTVAASGDFTESDSCIGSTIMPAKTCSIVITFNPSVAGAISGVITITDSATSPELINLSGSGLTPVTVSPGGLNFGTVAVVTTSTAQTVSVVNNQNVSLTLSYVASADYSASPGGSTPCNGSLAAFSKCTISVTFTPNTSGLIRGGLTISHSAVFSPQVVNLMGNGSSGSAGALTFLPASLSFKNVVGTTSAAKSVTVTNSSTSTINVGGIAASGNYVATGSGIHPCGGTLVAAAKCTFSVSFSPTVVGGINGAIAFSNDASVSPQFFNVLGTSVLPVSFSPGTLTFGPQNRGSISPIQVVTLTNNQTVSLAISGIVASGDFVVNSAGSNPCGSSLPAAASCTFGISFAPSQTGVIKGVVTVSHDAPYNPQEV